MQRMLLDPYNTIVGIARAVGVSRSTVYRLVREREWTRVCFVGVGASRGGYWTHRAQDAEHWNIMEHRDSEKPSVAK